MDKRTLYFFIRAYESIAFENSAQFMEALLNKELELREEAKAERLIKKAKFFQEKTLTSFERSEKIYFPHQLESEELGKLHFIAR